MRQDYAAFTARDAAVLAIGPDGPRAYQRFWEENEMPLIGLADPKHTVADLYRQGVNLRKLGRMPAVLVVDQAGFIRYQHYGESMSDIPLNEELLTKLGELQSPDDSRQG